MVGYRETKSISLEGGLTVNEQELITNVLMPILGGGAALLVGIVAGFLLVSFPVFRGIVNSIPVNFLNEVIACVEKRLKETVVDKPSTPAAGEEPGGGQN